MIAFVLFFVGSAGMVSAQWTVEECRRLARENYPLIKKYALVEEARGLDVSNVGKAWLPQVGLSARATMQSQVTRVPIDFSALGLRGVEIPTPSKDQYQAAVEVNQVLWDGGTIRAQRAAVEAASARDRAQVDVDMYAVGEETERLFFGILLMEEQLKQNRLLMEELERNGAVVKQSVANGVASAADVDWVAVEQLRAEQTETQLLASRRAFVEMLGMMIGQTLSDTASFLKPSTEGMEAMGRGRGLLRPETDLFEAEKAWLDTRNLLVRSALRPKIGVFVQGGYGRPGLDMLSDKFDLFYVGGVRLSWNFGALYTQKNDRQKIEIGKRMADVQRDRFLYAIDLAVSRENREIDRLRRLMESDEAIIALREHIRRATEAKVANGTATVSDLMHDLMHENLARTAKAVHEIDWLTAIYRLKNTTND